jgi:hypothetical protein
MERPHATRRPSQRNVEREQSRCLGEEPAPAPVQRLGVCLHTAGLSVGGRWPSCTCCVSTALTAQSEPGFIRSQRTDRPADGNRLGSRSIKNESRLTTRRSNCTPRLKRIQSSSNRLVNTIDSIIYCSKTQNHSAKPLASLYTYPAV